MKKQQHKHDRTIRVFISSTFRDMQEERDVLVKWVFPELRKRCRERSVELVEVDLRWGITEEQAQQGKTIPVCLDEIDRCRPYFLGMLGERYGWIPDNYKEDLLEVQPWIRNHLDKSVTELEFLYGLLNDDITQGQALVYYRDDQYSKRVPQSKRRDYVSEGNSAKLRLDDLKKRVKDKGVSLREIYKTPEEFGEYVLHDLWEAIDRDYPAGSEPTPLEIEATKHETFANIRRVVYIGREDYYKKLDNHIQNEASPLVVLGESGSGKSALVSNWVERYRNQNPDDLVFLHFIGGTADSADYIKLVQRLMETIKAWGLYDEEIPNESNKMVEMLPTWLSAAGSKQKFLIVLDALNQLDNRNAGQELGWLPHQLPHNVHLILSTLPGKVLQVLEKRKYPTLHVKPFNPDERKDLIVSYLDQYRKRLPENAIVKLVKAKTTENPLFLKTILGELRIMGVHEELHKKIDYYLSAKTIEDLYEKMLERMENDFDRVRPKLVQDALIYIWCSRRGLSESELLDLLGKNKTPLPRAYLSPMLLALDNLLLSSSGLLTFAHDRLRIAVMNRYARSGDFVEGFRQRLHLYFKHKDDLERAVDEVPYQLSRLKNWNQMHSFIRRIEVFEIAYFRDKTELLSWWFLLGDFYNMDESYRVALQSWENAGENEGLAVSKVIKVLDNLGSFYCFSGMTKEAELLFERAYHLSQKEYGEKSIETTYSMSSYGRILLENAKFKEAEHLLYLAYYLRKSTLGQKHNDTLMSMDELALLNLMKGDYTEAEELYTKGYEICKDTLGTIHQNTMQSLLGIAKVHLKKKKFHKAEPLQALAYETFRKSCGDEHPDTLISRSAYAYTLVKLEKFKDAEYHYRETLKIYENCFGPEHPGTLNSQCGLAFTLEGSGQIEEAEKLLHRVHMTQKRTLGGEHPDTINTQADWARLLFKKDEISTAELHFREVVHYQTRLLGSNHPDTLNSVYELAQVLLTEKEYSEAEPLFKDCYQRRKKTLGSDHEDTLIALMGLSDVAFILGDTKNAEEYLKQVLKLERSKKDRDELAICRVQSKLGSILSQKNNHSSAVLQFQASCLGREKIQGKSHAESLKSRKVWGVALFKNKELSEAKKILQEGLENAKSASTSDAVIISDIIAALAEVQESCHEFESAISNFKIALQLLEKSLGPMHQSYVRALSGLGRCYSSISEETKSLEIFQTAYKLACKIFHEKHQETVYVLSCLAEAQYKTGLFSEAHANIQIALNTRKSNASWPIELRIRDLDNLARIQIMLGILSSASDVLQESLSLKQKIYGRDHSSLSNSLELLSLAFLRQGSLLKAERSYRRITAIRKRESGGLSLPTLRCLTGLAISLFELENYNEAFNMLSKAIEGYNRLHPNGSTILNITMQCYIYWLDQCNRLIEGANYIGKVIRYNADNFTKNDPDGYEELILKAYSKFQDQEYALAWELFVDAEEKKDPMALNFFKHCIQRDAILPC